jgi:hypothetical protein
LRWFSQDPLVSSPNKTDRHDITEILLKVALNTIKQTNKYMYVCLTFCSLFITGAAVGGMNGIYNGYKEIKGASEVSTSVKRTQ